MDEIVIAEIIPYDYEESQPDTIKELRLTEEFSNQKSPFLSMYNAAMSEMNARFEIIKEEFAFRGMRCPIHHIDTRIKSAKSIIGKLRKKNLSLTLENACNRLMDIAGVRVVCSYMKDVYTIRERIMAQDDIRIVEEKDYIQNPKPNGYRSLHIIVRVPVYFMNSKQYVPVEIQLRTVAMDLWASLEHDIMYKSINADVEIDFTSELKKCSQLIYHAEAKMEQMNNLLEE